MTAFLTHGNLKTGLVLFYSNFFDFDVNRENEIFCFWGNQTFLLHKSATICQIYANEISNSKLKSLLLNNFRWKSGKLDLWLLRINHLTGTHVFWDTLYFIHLLSVLIGYQRKRQRLIKYLVDSSEVKVFIL